jgi:lysophospholipase L1-like esterase
MFALLTSAGYKVKFVGDQTINPGSLSAGNEHHEGIGGINIADLHSYLRSKDILRTYHPDVITLLIGYNSIYGARGITPSAAFSELRSLCDYMLLTLPSVRIVVGTLPPGSGDPGTDSATEGGQFNLSITGAGLTSLSSNISIANLNASMTLSGIGPDGLHPNQDGSDIIANVFGRAIMDLFPK